MNRTQKVDGRSTRKDAPIKPEKFAPGSVPGGMEMYGLPICKGCRFGMIHISEARYITVDGEEYCLNTHAKCEHVDRCAYVMNRTAGLLEKTQEVT